MEMRDEFRKSAATVLTARQLARTCGISSFPEKRILKKRILVPASILLLIAPMLWAAPRGQWQSAVRMQPSPASGQRGDAWFSGLHMGGPSQRQEHLPQWFRRHQYLSPQAQERALRNEPGFNRLPPAKQQRLLNRLRQLDAMPPLQRERTLQRMEAMERLSPDQRQEVRSAMQQVTMMPPERRMMVRKAFRDLSQMPPRERWAMLNSARFRAQFSNWERQMLSTLLSVQPYAPAPPPNPGLSYSGR